jgi:hypothetical protein
MKTGVVRHGVMTTVVVAAGLKDPTDKKKYYHIIRRPFGVFFC